MSEARGEGWLCGAWQPATKLMEAFRCTEPAGHDGPLHRATVDGQVLAEWPRDRGEE
jgi:hypothetical protein